MLSGCGDLVNSHSLNADQPAIEKGGPTAPVDAPTHGEPAPQDVPVPSALKWNYVQLDPDEVADRAYRMYPDGSCMYAVVGSIVTALADKMGEPFRSFPLHMMRYGASGVGSWGSLCGAVNGGCAAIGLIHGEKDREAREALITEYGVWYETTRLPRYQPAEGQETETSQASAAGSLLCHVSVEQWCTANNSDPYSAQRKERCRRLSADGARKVVQLLNADLAGEWIEGELTPEVFACVDCHGKGKESSVMARMNCGTCHQFEGKHP